jgi:hypothetical protein
MFVVTEADAAAIRTAFEREREPSAVIELRRRFPGVIDGAKAQACARAIAGWKPLSTHPRSVTRLHPDRDRQVLPCLTDVGGCHSFPRDIDVEGRGMLRVAHGA